MRVPPHWQWLYSLRQLSLEGSSGQLQQLLRTVAEALQQQLMIATADMEAPSPNTKA